MNIASCVLIAVEFNTSNQLCKYSRQEMTRIKVKPVININNAYKNIIRGAAVSTLSETKGDYQTLKTINDVPGPSTFPLIGQLHHFLPGGNLHGLVGMQLTDKLFHEYGPIVRFEGLFRRLGLLFLFDAESASQILRGENQLPDRPGFETFTYYRKIYKPKVLGKNQRLTGLVSDNGESWKEFRMKVNPILLQPKTIKLYEESLEQVAQDMVERLRSKRDENNMITDKFNEEINLWALESIGVVALGGRLNCLSDNLAEDSLVKRLIRCVHDMFQLSNELDFKVSLWKYYATKKFKKAMKTFEEQENICKEFIQKATETFHHSSKDTEKSVLQKLLDIDEEIAITMASDMLFTGVDTTSNTMTATLFYLGKNPEIQEKLRKEVLEKNERKYLKACLKESMRMQPVVSGNVRQVHKEYNILGYRIPTGTRIAFAHQYMSKMNKYFVKPDEFIPERWLVGKEDPLYFRNAHPFAYNPFGFGVRACIGRRIAELELETFLCKIMENFRLECVTSELNIKAVALNYIEEPLRFKFTDL